MKIIKASESDADDIKSFYNSFIIKGAVDYRIERQDSFFLQYKLVTDNYSTYFLKNNNDEIEAMASILFKKGYLNHKEQQIGYVTDLRVRPETTPRWATEFVGRLKQEMEENHCEHVFSELEQYENDLYNSLLRRRNRANSFTRYHLFRKFFLIMLFGRKFWRDEPLRSIKIDYAGTEDIEPICHYLRQKSVGKVLNSNISPDELERRFRVWPHFSIQNFLIARNYQGDIIGCMAPWNNKYVQQYVAHKYHSKSFQIYSSAKTLSSLGMLHPLPDEGEAFQLKFITHAAFDNPDIFYSLVDHAFEQCQNKELIVYPNYVGDYLTRPPRAFFSVKIPFGFYNLRDASEKLPPFLHPNPFTPPPDFSFSHF